MPDVDGAEESRIDSVRFVSLRLTNFLSYASETLEFGDLTALVGPNGSGKSNAISAIRLLHDIPLHGLPNAVARRGGFEQLRHRDASEKAHDPAIRIDFRLNGQEDTSHYELQLASLTGGRYAVLKEEGQVYLGAGDYCWFRHAVGKLRWQDHVNSGDRGTGTRSSTSVPPGQSAIPFAGFGAYFVAAVLQGMQTLELDPTRIGDLQEPSSTRTFEPDGSNVASLLAEMSQRERDELVELLAAIVPGVIGLSVREVADKVTAVFAQEARTGRHEFFAKQMSDGTLRVLGILVAIARGGNGLLAIEEPEVAIHLGALQTLVQILQAQTDSTQILLTTHSADIVDQLDLDDLRVVWSEDGASRIARVAEHTREPVRQGLITPGALLRADALDPSA